MGQLKRFWRGELRIYSELDLSETQLAEFERITSLPSEVKHNPAALGGRVALTTSTVDGIGDVVVKSYRRGGMLRFLLPSIFMRFGQSRSRLEFKMLQRVRACGVNTPEPIAYLEEGAFWYRAWLVTRAIPTDSSLITISHTDEARALRLGEAVSSELSRLIESRIHHVDLHPGNVVVDTSDRVFLVDFDKAREFSGDKNTLRDLYLRRWRRAVLKHHLPFLLSECVSLNLRAQYE